jgi:lariat debranching enzyme
VSLTYSEREYLFKVMRVVVEGCCHGELDKIYHTIEEIEQVIHDKIDLLLICGDFQAVRNQSDLASLACPLKYRKMQSFYKYYNGTIEAPLLTIFIGGNHEASNHLQELYFGGWVAHNIYYLGSAGVINVNGLRIAGLSGIYNSKHYHLGHYEIPPYDSDELRSVYHVRAFEVWKLKQLSGRIDIVLTHDWPRGIHYHGDAKKLLRKKSFLTQELLSNTLGSPPNEELLNCLQPAYWFSSHMHVKFPAIVKHQHPKDKPNFFHWISASLSVTFCK